MIWTKMHAVPTAVLMDADGKLGRSVQRQDNPADDCYRSFWEFRSMITRAIDRPTPDPQDVKVQTTMSPTHDGGDGENRRAMQHAFTRPYGCSVRVSGIGAVKK